MTRPAGDGRRGRAGGGPCHRGRPRSPARRPGYLGPRSPGGERTVCFGPGCLAPRRPCPPGRGGGGDGCQPGRCGPAAVVVGTGRPGRRGCPAGSGGVGTGPSGAVEVCDERFSTVIANRALMATGRKTPARREVVDKVAAADILQTWLDRHRNAGGAGGAARLRRGGVPSAPKLLRPPSRRARRLRDQQARKWGTACRRRQRGQPSRPAARSRPGR